MTIASNASLNITNLDSQTIQQIASLLDSDQDLVHFRQSCRSVSDSLEGDGSSFWRRRFLSKYERPYNFEDKKKWNNVHYKEQYQQRRPSLKNGALFKFGRTAAEKKCAEVLRDLIKGMIIRLRFALLDD